MIRIVVICIAMIAYVTSLGAADISVRVTDPRGFGYFLGDVVSRKVEVVSPAGTSLRAAALPRPGPVTYWLDLVKIDHQTGAAGGAVTNTITLTYQIFYSALEPKRMELPKLTLYFQDDTGKTGAENVSGRASEAGSGSSDGGKLALSRTVPPFEFIVSPLREIMPEKSDDPDQSPLRPDAEAMPQGTGAIRTGLLASLSLLALSLAGLAYHYAVWPFNMRRKRPFTQAQRALSALTNVGSAGRDGQASQDALRVLHRALDETYGRRVFARDLDDFIEQHHEFHRLEPQLRSFFSTSGRAFFASEERDGDRILSGDDLAALAAELAREERRAA